MKEQITKSEYLQLEGLLSLSTQAFRQLNEIESAVASIVGDGTELSDYDAGGYLVNDNADQGKTMKEVLKKAGIKVV